jgi:hypothetical protein
MAKSQIRHRYVPMYDRFGVDLVLKFSLFPSVRTWNLYVSLPCEIDVSCSFEAPTSTIGPDFHWKLFFKLNFEKWSKPWNSYLNFKYVPVNVTTISSLRDSLGSASKRVEVEGHSSSPAWTIRIHFLRWPFGPFNNPGGLSLTQICASHSYNCCAGRRSRVYIFIFI